MSTILLTLAMMPFVYFIAYFFYVMCRYDTIRNLLISVVVAAYILTFYIVFLFVYR